MSEKIKILVVDDDTENLSLMKAVFDPIYHVFIAKNGEDAIKIAQQEKPLVIILDVMMPGIDGFETCKRLKESSETMDIPVVFVTAVLDAKSERRGLNLGAMDYITKPISPGIVKVRIKNQIELKQARDKLSYLAMTDELTGLANRRRFDFVLANEVARHARNKNELCLIMIDLDHFKVYNDTHGHLQGDEALRKVAQVIQECMRRPADMAARYGGEEFACILPETTPVEGAATVAENIRSLILQLKLPNPEVNPPYLTASLGVAAHIFKPGETPDVIINAADKQLYKAKDLGRNRVSSDNIAN